MTLLKQLWRSVALAAIVLPMLGAAAQEAPFTEPVSRFRPTVSLDGIFGDRFGIDGNDYSASLLLPWHIQPDRHVVFTVLRATATDSSQLAANAGLGHRVYADPIDSIVGSSLWFDFDQSHRLTYQRLGGQLEVIGRYLEFRGGADFVLGGTSKTLVAPPAEDAAPFYHGNNIALGFFTAETPFDQAYVEAGGPLPWLDRFGLSAFAGAYFLWADDADGAVGGQARIAADVSRDVQVGARYSHDGTFGSNASVTVVLTIPDEGLIGMFQSFRSLTGRASSRSVASRMRNRVVREHRTPVKHAISSTPALAEDESGEPLLVLHVDPNLSAAGDGSIESPLASLEAARLSNNAGVDIIRVVPRGDGTGANLAVSAPLQLFANQRLLSSSVAHQFQAAQGTFSLPGLTGGSGPLLSNSQSAAGAVVVMVDGSEVSGFTIDGSGRHIGLQGNIDSFDINRNTIQNALNGVQMTNAQGVGVLRQNNFRDNLNDGVSITATGGNLLNLQLSGNVGTGNGDDAVDVTTTETPLVVTFTGNDFGGNGGDGISLTSQMDSTVAATLKSNQLGDDGSAMVGNAGAGFRFTSDSGFATFTFGGNKPSDGNIVLGNAGGELEFNLSNTAAAIVNSQNDVMPVPPVGTNSFEIEVEFGGGFTASQRALFESAAARWESIIIGDLPSIGSIDDVRIVAIADAIDGSGGTLAEASPLGLRSGSYLPFMGEMRFDSADLFSLEASGKLDDVIRHEMAHVLGFGTLWNYKGMLSGGGGNDPRFVGAQATAEYNARFGASASGVPLDNSGDEGTTDAHWRESEFTTELMTGFIDGATQPISRITIGQFIDLGYQADVSQADPF